MGGAVNTHYPQCGGITCHWTAIPRLAFRNEPPLLRPLPQRNQTLSWIKKKTLENRRGRIELFPDAVEGTLERFGSIFVRVPHRLLTSKAFTAVLDAGRELANSRSNSSSKDSPAATSRHARRIRPRRPCQASSAKC